MSKIVVIIGYGSVGQRHAKLFKEKQKDFKNLYSFFKKKIPYSKIKTIDEIKIINPDLIIVATYSKSHLRYILYIERYLKKKVVLIEKPLFNTLSKKYLPTKNLYFVGYNLRFHPIISFFKKTLNNKKICFLKPYPIPIFLIGKKYSIL